MPSTTAAPTTPATMSTTAAAASAASAAMAAAAASAASAAIATTMTAPAKAGDLEIAVASSAGFAIGNVISIGNETNTVQGFGSIILAIPLISGHPTGTAIVVIHGTNASRAVQGTTKATDA